MESKSIERQQFEDAWVNDNSSTPSESERVRDALKRIWIVNDSGEGAYFDSFVMMAWVWWQKSRAALVVELPSADAFDSTWQFKDGVEQTLRAAGITVKGEVDEKANL